MIIFHSVTVLESQSCRLLACMCVHLHSAPYILSFVNQWLVTEDIDSAPARTVFVVKIEEVNTQTYTQLKK